ncbi:hypothetical protein ACGFNV_34885 [Streptomyces sp. NPDC048751]|uniref:hypothetical protein n=1 Tax=Streptomyces sp. NPDC048751 TaxID=3365591 RepID=UPI0037108F52
MSAPEALPALTAGVSTGLVLLLRWAATRNADPARPPHNGDPTGLAPDDPVLRQAEEHVRHYWARVRPLYPTPRD